ncbi:MAG: bifunctional phosphopantothenoylcysteine decarboxylase/phosphopantothenate--cysteine ligase CoaBC [Alphaproteobacteria bacterium]|nr:MAG: bifunctional phosphopantothenoylcysteine decarboxylase/phosphopantothenate--cysteine ligase CoaBC [Alphaproteobacteria bacterium]
MTDFNGKRVLLIIGGGIAAYKVLELIRRLKERGAGVRVILTQAGQQFITPLSVGALTHERVFTDLFDLDDEREIGHIRLSRQADLIVVAPATADTIAKMASGLCNDLASTVLMASDKPVLIAPAMNPKMWDHPATRRNVKQLRADGVALIGPEEGEMAEEGEAGIGRMAEPATILAAIEERLAALDGNQAGQFLKGRRAIVTSGPTHEPIDPVRYLANRSSGKQGHAIAAALAAAGAEVTLISGPVTLAAPDGVTTLAVETAEEMLKQVEAALPADIAVMTAAVADWRVTEAATTKIKKTGKAPPALKLTRNPDILAALAAHSNRPELVIGFAAETNNLLKNAQAKLAAKGCDWIVANDVSATSGVAGGVLGGDANRVHLLTAAGSDAWPEMSKAEVASRLVQRIAEYFGDDRPRRRDEAEAHPS